VSKEELMAKVWPNTFVEESNLTQNIYTLRKALGQTPDGQGYVVTIPRRGYRFAAPLFFNAPTATPARWKRRVPRVAPCSRLFDEA
jgi:DNA-binding winged helix-turn-helix (wHTH) protein